jgi:CelD/BcsL family acetyltransferase involved in cellulose biosynthesis
MALFMPAISDVPSRGQRIGTLSLAAGPYAVERWDSAEALHALMAGPEAARAVTGFQQSDWLEGIYRHLAPTTGARAVVLAVRLAVGGALVLVLPLVVRRDSGFEIAYAADLGVSDYNVPLAGPGGGVPLNAKALMAAIKRALPDVDVVCLDRMLCCAANPLASHPSAQPSRHQGNALTIIDSVDAYVRSRGKKYRKEVERCFRVLASEGPWAFARCVRDPDIAVAFAALERQQAQRHADSTEDYALAQPEFADFYRDALRRGSTHSGAQIFTLSVKGEIIAVLLGVVHDTTFILLRIANGGDAWRHVSPGRLIVVEAMRALFESGVRTFDMGIGDYQFKRGFGAEKVALVDLVDAVSVKGMAWVACVRTKRALRQNEQLRRLVTRWRERKLLG